MTFDSDFREKINSYVSLVRQEFEVAIKNWPSQAALNDVQAVMGGLLSRQCVLGSMLARRLDYWDGLIAPLCLRAMVEVYINISWISLNPEERSRKYISYGLGQSKLELEHARNLESLSKLSKNIIDSKASWLHSQRHELLTDVDVGLWAGIDLKSMAVETGLEKYYTLYSFLGPAAHGSWDHVFVHYLDRECSTPSPLIPQPCFKPSVPMLLAELINITFERFNKLVGNTHDSSAYHYFLANFSRSKKE